MFIEFNCEGCGQRYRVREELAGRMVQCKHCGHKMAVPPTREEQAPPPAAVAARDESDSSLDPPNLEFAASNQDSSPDENELDAPPVNVGAFDVRDDEPEAADVHRERQSSILPPMVADIVLPLLLIVAGLGGAMAIAVP